MKSGIHFRIQPLFLGLLLVATLALFGCSSTQASTGGTQAEPMQTSVQLSWVDTIEFVGLYEGIRQGYYTEKNLQVRLDTGGFNESGAYIDPVTQVVEGKSDFGVAGADVVLLARAQGQPVVAVASIYQRSPVVLVSLGDQNVTRPQDLVGKRIQTQPPNSTIGIAYEALLKSQNIDHAQLVEQPRTDYTITPLTSGEADVLPGFITNDGVRAQLNSDKVNFIVLSDYGIDIYSNVIFTTEDMIKNKPELVEAFVQGTVKGMQWAIDHPEDASKYVLDQYGKDMTPDIQESQKPGLLASLPLMKPAGSEPGKMTAENWEFTHQVLLDQGLLTEAIDVKSSYNLTFLDKAYNQ
jgi:ABC-type nitrate/sulfonate/bicarbonate transport system substrate-binding protein